MRNERRREGFSENTTSPEVPGHRSFQESSRSTASWHAGADGNHVSLIVREAAVPFVNMMQFSYSVRATGIRALFPASAISLRFMAGFTFGRLVMATTPRPGCPSRDSLVNRVGCSRVRLSAQLIPARGPRPPRSQPLLPPSLACCAHGARRTPGGATNGPAPGRQRQRPGGLAVRAGGGEALPRVQRDRPGTRTRGWGRHGRGGRSRREAPVGTGPLDHLFPKCSHAEKR